MEFEDMPEDPFITCLFDEPGIAVWRHDGEPGGPHYVLDIVEGYEIPHERVGRAMDTLPNGVGGAFEVMVS